MAKIIGTAGTAPAARKVNRTPPRKTVPISRVPGIGQRRNYVAPKPHPAPRVIHDSGVANNAPVRRRAAPSAAIIKASRQFGIGLSPAQTMAQQHRIHRDAQARAAHLAARMDVLHSLGLGPARTIRSVGFGQSPTMLIGDQRRGATLRDSGVANNPAPSYHGQSISPQAVQRAMHSILRRGHSLQSQDAIGLLHAAGVSDPFGSTTPKEHQQTAQAAARYRKALVRHVTQMQLDWQETGGRGGIGLSPMEIEAKLRNLPIRELERLTHWTPSQNDQLHGQLSTAGFSVKGFQQIGAAVGGLASGAIKANIPGIGGRVLGNAAGDLVEIPGEVVPSLYYAVKPLAHGDVKTTASRFLQPYADIIKHPGKSLVDHPLGTALMVTGAFRGAGRGAGFALRHGTPAMRAAGSLDRGVARLPDTQYSEVRRYSPDIVAKQFQKRRDLRGYAKAHDFYKQAHQAETEAIRIQQHGGDAEALFKRAAHMREQAYHADPSIITDASKATSGIRRSSLQRAHDEFESLAEGLRRLDRGRVVRDASKALGRKPSNLTRPVVEGIVAASRKHVEAYLEQIKQEAKGLDPVVDRSNLLANEQLQEQIRKALDDPKTDMGAVLARAEKYRAVVGPLQAELSARKLVNPEQADRAALTSYAVRYMGAKLQKAHYVDEHGTPLSGTEVAAIRRAHPASEVRQLVTHVSDRIVGPHGRPFTPAEVRAHMAAARKDGVPLISDPAYVSQQPFLRSSGAYFRRWNPRVGVQTGKRTGKAVTEGTIDIHPSTLVDQAARTQSLLSADKAFTAHIDQFAYRHGGRVFTAGTKKAAMELKRTLEAHGSPVKWQAVRLNPLGANQEALGALLDSTVHDEHTARQAVHETLADAYAGKGPDGGPWTLLPEQVANRAQEFQKLLGAKAGVKALEKATSIFRKVVLARPSFLIGNAFEATVRGFLKGALPGSPDYFLMRRVLDALPAADKDSVLQGVVGGGHMHMVTTAHVNRSIEQFGDGRVARAMQGASHTLPARTITNAWTHFNHVLFEEINGRLERQFRIALAGKAMRQQLLPTKLLALSEKSVAEAAQGLTDTATQRMLGREVDRAYGQYDKFSPEQRKWLMLYTPFAAWLMNSIRFVLQTLPRDHPVVTGLIAAANQTSADYRKAHGLTQLGGSNTKRVPGFLQGTIPGGDGSFLRTFTRYTPAGFWSDPLASVGGAVMPQLSGVEAAFKGTDWKGTPLKDNSFFGKLSEAGKEAAAELIPGYGQGQQVFTGKGTTPERVRKFFDPFMYTKSAAAAAGGGASVGPPRNAVEAAQRRAQQHLAATAGGGLSPAVVAAQKRAQQMLAGKTP